MLANNNQRVVTRLAKRALKSNSRRSLLMITAVVLSSFMMFCVLTVGITYFKMQRLQNIRLNGAKFDAVMYGVTQEQQKMCEENSDIEACGIFAVAGSVIETAEDSTPNVGLIWADDTCWSKMMEPARAWAEGEYPQQADELMVTKESLKECGAEHLGIGDSITMKYRDASGLHTKDFRISGMWEGYGEKKVFYVSKAFYQQSGKELADVSSGRYFIKFKRDIITQKEQNDLIESMNLGKQQRLIYMAESSNSVEIVMGIAGLILVTCLCAYLLIYNILYLSVSGNIRYYGLLQTVGMTGKQIRGLMKKQMLFIGTIGTLAGIALGSGVSFFLIPAIVKLLGIQSGKGSEIEVAFHPVIFLATILLTGFTVYIGSRKPAKMASAVSPIEALGYRTAAGKNNIRKAAKGRLLFRMARGQLTKDKKKSGIVILSLAAGMSVFLCLVTLIESQGARTILSNYMEMDMVIKNDTLKKEDRADWTQILDEKFMTTLQSSDAVQEITPILSAEITVPWEPDFSDLWMREFYDTWMTVPYENEIEEYKEHPENFGSFLIGICDAEFDYLNRTIETPVDQEAFRKGEVCILYLNGLDFMPKELNGKKVTCAEYADSSNTRTFEIAGLTRETYYSGPLIGYPPVIIVSDAVIKDFIPESFLYKAGVKYKKEYDENAENSLLSLMQESPYHKDFSYDSKLIELKSMEKAQGGMMEVGFGIVLILAAIGIMNYMNTVTGNIQSREVELAILESVGMTEKQADKMLIIEGLLFAGCSLLLTAAAGTGITYWLYQSMNYRGIPFSIPVLPVLGMVLFIILVCTAIPLAARRALVKKGSIIERIRGFE